MANVVIITCHDLGSYLSCYGARTVRTPHLDRLAAEGVRFARAFCTAPQCSPSRASLFTGRYPHANGVMGLTHAEFAWDLYPDERHIGQILHERGYRTPVHGIHHESRADDSSCAGVRRDLLRRLSKWLHATDEPILDGAITSSMHHEAPGHLCGIAARRG